MDWRRGSGALSLLAALLPLAHCWSIASANARTQQKNEISPYLDLVLCPIREEPWSCARQQSARVLDLWDAELQTQWQKLKVEADRQLNATIEKRGYSASEQLTKEKPSTILKKIEIGTGFMKQYLAETMDGFLGREYDYIQTTKNHNSVSDDDEDDDDDDDNNNDNNDDDESADSHEDEDDDESVGSVSTHDSDDYADRGENVRPNGPSHSGLSSENDADNLPQIVGTAAAAPIVDDGSGGIEFIEIGGAQGQLKKPGGGGGGGGGNKNKRKKKPSAVLVVQPAELELHGHGHGGHDHVGDTAFGGHGHGGGSVKPAKMKRKKRKKRPQLDEHTVIVEHEPSGHLGLGLLEELADAVDVGDVGGGGGKRKHKHPSKYGRSVGVTRGKKKKKRKALAKLVLLGSFLKAKIELLLKILGAHLQIKFFAIALIGLLINIARFWIDVKRGGVPQKVVYVEHAHHQHHYEEHGGGDDWGEQGGSYWKRSLKTDPTVDEDASYAATDSYQPVQQHDPHYMAYQGQWH